jgi:hypothetical protein
MSDELLASDDEREQAVARLRTASAEGRLTLDELAVRTGSAYAARTHGELGAVTAGLPVRASSAAPARRRAWPGLVVGIFAPMSRRRRRRVGRHTIVFSVFAPTKLDLRSAVFEAGDTATIEILGVFAPVTIVVPRHVDVDTLLLPVFAPIRESGSAGDLPPGAPRVRIVGLAVFAPVVVRYGDS